MANQTSHLFDLIKKLSPAENKLVMKYAFPYKKGGDSILRMLYLLLKKQQVYDETIIRQKIKNLPARKLELWKKIMLVLQTNNNTSQILIARRKLDFIHILASKQLFAQIPTMLIDLKRWGVDFNQMYYHAIVLQYESNYFEMLYDQDVPAKMKMLRTEIMEVSNSISLTAQAYEFYLRVIDLDRNNNLYRDNKAAESALAMQSDPLFLLPTQDMSMQCLLIFIDAKSTLLYMQRQYIESLEMENKVRQIYLAKEPKTAIDIYNYCTFLSNLMTLHDKTNSMIQWEQDVIEINKIIAQNFNTDVIRITKTCMFTFWFYYRKNKFKDKPTLIQETLQHCQDYKPLITELDLKYHEWNFIIAFFDLGDYDKAWHYCNEFINNTSATILPDVQEYIQLFFLFILLEKKEYAYLANRRKLYQKQIENKDSQQYAFDLAILAFIKKMAAPNIAVSEQRKQWNNLKNKLQELHDANNIYTIDVLHLFDFRAWIQSNKLIS